MRASTSGNSPLGVVAPGARHAWGPSRPGSIMKGEEAPPCGDLLRAGSLRRRCGSGAAILRKHIEGSLLAQAVQQPVHRLLDRKGLVEGTSWSVRVDLAGERIVRKKKECMQRDA